MIGDFTPGKTVRVLWNTHKADGTPITLAGTPAISVYKDGGTTESTAGVSLSVDHDGRTGLHLATVDTSADGSFYVAGSDFRLVITAGTVDSISVVGSVVGGFSLANRSALRSTTADRTLDVSAGGEAGVDLANVGSPTTVLNLSGTSVKTATDVEADTQDLQARTPAALVSGRMDSSVGAISADAQTLIAAVSIGQSNVHVGDRSPGDVVRLFFRTPAELVDGNLAIRKNGQVFLGASGATLTQVEGTLYRVDVDTAVNPTAYVSGSSFMATLSNGTVDGVDIAGMVVGTFTVGMTGLALLSGPLDGSTLSEALGNLPTYDDELGVHVVDGGISAATFLPDSIDANALAADAVAEITAGITSPTADAIAEAVLDKALVGHTTAGTVGEALSRLDGSIGSVLTALGAVSVDTSGVAAAVWAHATRTLSSIGSTLVKQISVVSQSGEVTIFQGDTYDSEDGIGHALQWQSNDPCLQIEGVTTFYIYTKAGELVVEKEIGLSLITGTTYLISADLTSLETAELSVGTRKYKINVVHVTPPTTEDPLPEGELVKPDHINAIVVAKMTVKNRKKIEV